MDKLMVALKDAEVAIAAARAGAEAALSLFGQRFDRTGRSAELLGMNADVGSETAIIGVLHAARPEDAVLGEQGDGQGPDDAGRQWLIHPLCGTLNYGVGGMPVGVSVALEGGAAAVADPFSGEVFGTDGERAWVRRDGEDVPLVPTAATALVDVNVDPPYPGAPAFRAVDVLAHPEFLMWFHPRVVSSTVALAWVAAGRRAAYLTDGENLAGHGQFAAGVALCRAAGCVVTGIDGGPAGAGGRGLLAAADAETHAALLAIVRKVTRPDGG